MIYLFIVMQLIFIVLNGIKENDITNLNSIWYLVFAVIKNLFNITIETYIFCTGLSILKIIKISNVPATKNLLTIIWALCMLIHIRNMTGDTFTYLSNNDHTCSEAARGFATVMEVAKLTLYPLIYQITMVIVVAYFAALQVGFAITRETDSTNEDLNRTSKQFSDELESFRNSDNSS